MHACMPAQPPPPACLIRSKPHDIDFIRGGATRHDGWWERWKSSGCMPSRQAGAWIRNGMSELARKRVLFVGFVPQLIGSEWSGLTGLTGFMVHQNCKTDENM